MTIDRPFTGLIAATHTPFRADGGLNLDAVELQAAGLLRHGVAAVFIAGTTGEGSSLTSGERRLLTERWVSVARGTSLRVMVHVGHNSIHEARELAAHAAGAGADAISAMPPTYFRPPDVAALVSFAADVASGAPDLPFFYYHIPAMTGVGLSMPDFLAAADGVIPNLAGLKYSDMDLAGVLRCREVAGGKYPLLFGCDEALLAGWVMGLRGAVGSTYNFAAPVYHRLLAAAGRGDFEEARKWQLRSAAVVAVLAKRGFMASAKRLMARLGADCGPVRPPLRSLGDAEAGAMLAELEALGFFDWAVEPVAGA